MEKKDVLDKLFALEKELDRRPVKRDSSQLYNLSRMYFGSWNNMMQDAGYKCQSFQHPIVPSELSSELAYLLGLISTDGHMQVLNERHGYRVMIYTSEKEEIEIISRLIQFLFNYRVSVK